MKKRVVLFSIPAGLMVLFAAVAAWAADFPMQEFNLTRAYLTLGILAVATILFFTEFFPVPITALLVPVALAVCGIITPKAAFANWGDPTVILFMGMFVVGESIFKTGFADKIGKVTMDLTRGDEVKLLLLVMIVISAMSSVLSNMGTMAVAMPMVIAMCRTANIAPARLLIPAAFAASLGGTCSLIGTPPNGIMNTMLSNAAVMTPAGIAIRPFGFFEFAKFGIPFVIMGILYYAFIGKRFLHAHVSRAQASGSAKDAENGVAMMPVAASSRKDKMMYSVGIFLFVLVVMVTEVIELHVAAVFGMCLAVITGCLTMKEAFEAVDWQTIWLFSGMLSMSTAMESSGAGVFIVQKIVGMVSSPFAILAVVCALTALLTNFMSDTATVVLMGPLAIPLAIQTGISPMPLAMGIAMSASACFLTPIATPSNTIILGAGNYSFMDYAKSGWPLQIGAFIMCLVLIPIFWPL